MSLTDFSRIDVLLVEDELFTRKTLRRMLQSLGCSRILEASDGSEALKLLQGDPRPDLVICDVQMEPMGGLAFLRGVRSLADPARAGLPMIMLTSVASRETIADTASLGVSNYLLKPVSIEQLAGRIRSIFKPPQLRVMLIEDEPFIRSTLKRMLRSLGCSTVVEANDGTEALASLGGESPPNLAICDVQMEPLGGIAFLQQLRSMTDPAQAGLPVIMLTSVSDAGTIKDTAGLGVSGYLLKPVSTSRLAERIKAIFPQHAAGGPAAEWTGRMS